MSCTIFVIFWLLLFPKLDFPLNWPICLIFSRSIICFNICLMLHSPTTLNPTILRFFPCSSSLSSLHRHHNHHHHFCHVDIFSFSRILLFLWFSLTFYKISFIDKWRKSVVCRPKEDSYCWNRPLQILKISSTSLWRRNLRWGKVGTGPPSVGSGVAWLYRWVHVRAHFISRVIDKSRLWYIVKTAMSVILAIVSRRNYDRDSIVKKRIK